MHDDTTTVSQMRDMIAAFVAERRWEHFHRPKHLAMSIAIEAAELMEHFQWTDAEGMLEGKPMGTQQKAAAVEELCDVLAYVLSMANALDVDLASAFEAKMGKNAVKHPAPVREG